jgi:hypothetical protein
MNLTLRDPPDRSSTRTPFQWAWWIRSVSDARLNDGEDTQPPKRATHSASGRMRTPSGGVDVLGEEELDAAGW